MPQITILNPNDQPTGKLRFLEELRNCLTSTDYDEFLMTVAFVKSGPLFRLQPQIDNWLARKKPITAIYGINHRGTSKQALAFALSHFSKTYILFANDYFTFHPKIYLFLGPKRCRFYIGSHNLTVGGTETNWECGLRLDLALPADQQILNAMLTIWKDLVPLAGELTRPLLQGPDLEGLLLDETKRRRSTRSSGGSGI